MSLRNFFRNLKQKLMPAPKPVIPTPKTVVQQQPDQKPKPEMLIANRRERRKKANSSKNLRPIKYRGDKLKVIQAGDMSMLLVKDPHERVKWLKKNFSRIASTYGTHAWKKIIALAALGLTRKQLRAYKINVRPKTIRIRAGCGS